MVAASRIERRPSTPGLDGLDGAINEVLDATIPVLGELDSHGRLQHRGEVDMSAFGLDSTAVQDVLPTPQSHARFLSGCQPSRKVFAIEDFTEKRVSRRHVIT